MSKPATYGFTETQHALRSVHLEIKEGDAFFFITLCIRERACLLGNISDANMHLSELGMFVFNEWSRLSTGLPHIRNGSWIVMPNHVHGIIMMGQQDHDFLLSSMIKRFRRNTTDFFRQQQETSSGLWHKEHYIYRIQSPESYGWINHYILHNPSVWERDKYFKK